MTPEARAQKLMPKILSGISRPVTIRDVDIASWITESLRAAIAEEREACAMVIQERLQPLTREDTSEDTSYEVIGKKMCNEERMACMDAIRARST